MITKASMHGLKVCEYVWDFFGDKASLATALSYPSCNSIPNNLILLTLRRKQLESKIHLIYFSVAGLITGTKQNLDRVESVTKNAVLKERYFRVRVLILPRFSMKDEFTSKVTCYLGTGGFNCLKSFLGSRYLGMFANSKNNVAVYDVIFSCL